MTANSLVAKSRLAAAQTLTASSPINGIKDSALWLESAVDTSFADGETSNNTSISNWNDSRTHSPTKVSVVKVGNGPVYSNTINYVHAVKFVGNSSDYLKIEDASFLNNTDYTVFVLEKRHSSSSNNYFLGDSSIVTANQNLLLGYSADNQVIHSQAGSNSYNSTITGYSTSNKPRMFTFVSDSSGKRTYINGVLAAQSSDTSQLSGITELAIGKGYTGEIGEIAIFTRGLKNEERKSTEDYIGKKWTTKVNRDAVANGSCVGYTVTDSGCDMASATCNISQTGISATVSPTSSATTLSCNATRYTGSITYTCVNGTASVSSHKCLCATGNAGTGCSNCDTDNGYIPSGGSCILAAGCSVSGTGITTTTVAHGATGSVSCTGNFSGSISYNCNNGNSNQSGSCSCINNYALPSCSSCNTGYSIGSNCTACTNPGYSMVSGTCQQQCSITGITGITNGTYADQGTAKSLSCNGTNFNTGDTITYNCVGATFTKTGGNCDTCAAGFTYNSGTETCDGGTCTGGTITTVAGKTIHTFTSYGSLVCGSAKTAQVLVVGGGGSGGSAMHAGGGGGGGAGGVVYAATYPLAATSYTVTVGNGGAGVGVLNSPVQGVNGGNSIFGTMTANGGGGGGTYNGSTTTGLAGGSSGGAGGAFGANALNANQANQTNATSYYGNRGGHTSNGSPYSGAGGGGAGGIGGAGGVTSAGGAGGAGVANSISGSSVFYAGGGGGSGGSGSNAGGAGGSGGGGQGGRGESNRTGQTSGTNNTGGGGGGANNALSGAGGTGVVIVAY